MYRIITEMNKKIKKKKLEKQILIKRKLLKDKLSHYMFTIFYFFKKKLSKKN